MAVAASLLGGVVQVMKEGKDSFNFTENYPPLSFLISCLFHQALNADVHAHQIKPTQKIQSKLSSKGDLLKLVMR
jgi:hypothetical protein